MKQNGYRVIAVVGIVVAVAAIGISVAGMARAADSSAGESSSGLKSGETLEIGSASALEFDGMWDVTITRGPASAKLSGDERMIKAVRYDQSGERLSFRTEGVNFGGSLHLDLTVPSLESLEFRGAGSVRLRDFSSEKMTLTLDGGCSLEAEGGTIGNLDLTSRGASNIDLSDSKVTNARVSIDGASNATFTMDGGVLEGSINGVGRLGYAGTVSSESVRTEGLAKVEKE